jgi:CelD/BcsL family acetyltransferase involved in cellulose biosynthesis
VTGRAGRAAAASEGVPLTASDALEVSVYCDARAFSELREEWIGLEQHAADSNIFLTWAWQHAWWEEMGTGRLDLLACRAGDHLVGIVPAYHEEVGTQRVVRFGGGLEVTDYLGFIVSPGYEHAVAEAFLLRCRQFTELVVDLHFMRQDSTTLRALQETADDLGLSYQIEQEEVSPRIVLAGDWEGYLAQLDKKDRHEIRRKRRRLEEAGGWTIHDSTAATLDADLETFFRLHAMSSRAKEDFLTDGNKEFFRHICSDLQREGWLSLRTLAVEGRPAAAVLGFVYGDKLLAYNSGYDPDFNRLSAGFVLMTEEIRLSIEAGLREVDFLRGDEKYKYDLGSTDVPLMHLLLGPEG